MHSDHTSLTQRIPGPAFQRKRPLNDLTRDERIKIRTLREYLHWNDFQIAASTRKTVREVQHALKGPLTPPKRSDRRPKFKFVPVGTKRSQPITLGQRKSLFFGRPSRASPRPLEASSPPGRGQKEQCGEARMKWEPASSRVAGEGGMRNGRICWPRSVRDNRPIGLTMAGAQTTSR